MNNYILRPRTVKLLQRFIKPLVDEGIIFVSEEKEIVSNLKCLSEKGSLMPAVSPRLIDQKEAAEMLGIGHSNFKKLESEGAFPFKRKMVGSSVRYRNTDIYSYIIND